jgi:putative DNA primase/helicase
LSPFFEAASQTESHSYSPTLASGSQYTPGQIQEDNWRDIAITLVGRQAELRVTGGDTVSARFLYKEHFQYKPQFKLWLSTNHKPEIVGTDEGIWRRIRLVPFNVHFEQDITLQDILLTEADGIMSWAVEGLKQWRLHGLMEPEAVLNATTEYRADEDTLIRFLHSERLELGKEHKCGRDLWQQHKNWSRDNHEPELSEWKFSDAMKEHGYAKLPRSKQGVQYQGVRKAHQPVEATIAARGETGC